jgi:hypothetical protein
MLWFCRGSINPDTTTESNSSLGPIAATDQIADVTTKISNAIVADPDLTVVVTNTTPSTGIISLACKWPGSIGNDNRVRRIGVLGFGDENDPLAKPRLSALTQALADLGWTDGRNVRMDLRWGGGDIDRIRAFAQELVGL